MKLTTPLTRREMLGNLAASIPIIAAAPSILSAEAAGRKRLGVCTYSYGIHWKAAHDGYPNVPFKDTLDFIDYCHGLGAGGVQIAVDSKELDYPAKIRARAEAHHMHFEGQVNLPKDSADLDRFEAGLRAGQEAGAEVFRAALDGRRYETFDSLEEFSQFSAKSWQSLTLAEPVLKKHGLRLAIENHKDCRVSELLDILKRLSSEWVGVCVDTGNSLALLEDPMAVVEQLAPFAVSTHLKDMAVQEYEEGFLLSEVPLGEGFLDLKRMVSILHQSNPKLHFNLEMITRDPLKIPCLTEKYFTTMPALSAREMAAALAQVRRHASKKPLPHITGLSIDAQLALEDEQVRKSFAYARRELGL